jgi:hypothetical protein
MLSLPEPADELSRDLKAAAAARHGREPGSRRDRRWLVPQPVLRTVASARAVIRPRTQPVPVHVSDMQPHEWGFDGAAWAVTPTSVSASNPGV